MSTSHAMRHADAAWLHMDRPSNLMIINSALWFDEPVPEERLRAVVQERLVDRYPRFRQRVVEGLTGPHWEDDDEFSLDLHIHHLALPAPGDRETLQRVIGDLMAQPLDRSRPLWSLHLFDGYGDGCAISVRMHHAIADGIALARVMLGLTDHAPDAGVEETVDAPRARARLPLEGTVRDAAHLTRVVAHEATESLLHPSHLADLTRAGAADARSLTGLLLSPTESKHPLHRELGVGQRVAWSEPLALADVKAAGRRHSATINDVLVAAVAGAVRRHLEAEGVEPCQVHAMVPFNLRPLDQPLPRDLGNRFGLVILDLPVEVADPVERLRAASERMLAIKNSRDGAVSYGVLGVIGRTPSAVESRIIDIFSAKATMVLTNVPGPRAPVYLAGVEVKGVLVWAPASGAVGMSVSIFSYDGNVMVGFMVNGRLVEDPGVLVRAFEAEARTLIEPPRKKQQRKKQQA